MTQTQSTELSLRDHAFQEIDAVAAGIAALAAKYTGVVYDVTTTKGMEDAKKARAEIREPRYQVEKIRAGKASELRTIAGDINVRAKAITADILAIEGPIQAQIEAEEERKLAIKQAREAAEQAERDRQVGIIAQLAALPGHYIGATVEELDNVIDGVMSTSLALDEVYMPSGMAAKDKALEDLAVMRTQRALADDQAKELAELKAKTEREEAERAEREAADKAARERNEAITAAIDSIKGTPLACVGREPAYISSAMQDLDSMLVNADNYGDRVAEAQTAKTAALQHMNTLLDSAMATAKVAADQAEQQKLLDAEAAKQRKEREEAEAAERDRRYAEEQEATQRALEAQREAIRTATADEAMRDALALLEREGYGQTVEAEKLRAVLGRTED